MASAAAPGVTETPRAELLASLAAHNQTFTALLSLIPAHLYAKPSAEEAEERWKTANVKKGKAKRARDEREDEAAGASAQKGAEKAKMSKEGRKREEKARREEEERREARKRGKMARMDPSNLPAANLFSTLPAASGSSSGPEASSGSKAAPKPALSSASAGSTSGAGPSQSKSKTAPAPSPSSSMPPAIPPSSLSPSSSARSPSLSLPTIPPAASAASTSGSVPTASSASTPSASISDLRARLHHKIASLQRSRGLEPLSHPGTGSNSQALGGSRVSGAGGAHDSRSEDAEADAGLGLGSGPGSRDELERERRERREKRAELREKKRARVKEARERERVAEKAAAREAARIPAPVPSVVATGSQRVPQETDGLSYGTLAIPASSGPGLGSASSSKAAAGGKFKHISNPSQALEHLQARQDKVAAMSEEKREAVQERERWAKAEERAAGAKVVDEERTLKKAVKRLEKRKAKSGKEWVDRKKALALSQQAAIKKRNDNIAARNDARKNKKKGIKGKSGDKKVKKRPGFEGGRNKKGGDKGKGKGKSK